MTLPQPKLGEVLLVTDDDDGSDLLRRYRVSLAEYSIYHHDGVHRMCIHASADKLVEPEGLPDWENAQPWLEVRLAFTSSEEAEMTPGRLFRTPAYNYETDEWLTNFYHFSHGGLEDTEVEVLGTGGRSVDLEVCGCSEAAGPIRVRARFQLNEALRPQ